MQINYRCADCDESFPIRISEREFRTTISGIRAEACPCCRQQVGYGKVTCRHCGNPFVARMPLRHTQRRLAFGQCPNCHKLHLQPVDLENATV